MTPAVDEIAADALRWVASTAVPAEGGLAWLGPNSPGQLPADDLYEGTAGVLAGLAQARLTGITEFDEVARAATARRAADVGGGQRRRRGGAGRRGRDHAAGRGRA